MRALVAPMRRVRLCAVLLAAISAVLGAGRPVPALGQKPAVKTARAEPKPIAVLLIRSAWFGRVDRPLFILYDDGRVIYPSARERTGPGAYQVAQIDVRHRDRALADLGVSQEFFGLKEKYSVRPDSSDDLESLFLYVWRGEAVTRVTVRGGIVGDDSLSPGVPAPFRAAYRGFTSFKGASAAPWRPETLDVTVWPFEAAPDRSPVAWPAGWPDLKSPGKETRKDKIVGEIWTLHLRYSHRDELDKLLQARRVTQAIMINGRKCSVLYRVAFPGERRWEKLQVEDDLF